MSNREIRRPAYPYRMYLSRIGQVVIRQSEYVFEATGQEFEQVVLLDPSQVDTFVSDLYSLIER